MGRRTVQLTREQVELAQIKVKADRLQGREPDPLLLRIATVDGEPARLAPEQVRPQDRSAG